MAGAGDALRAQLEELERIDRPSASAGELRADAVRLSESAVRRLGERWLWRSGLGPAPALGHV